MTQGITQTEGVRALLRQCHRLLTLRQPLVRIAKNAQRTSRKALAHHASVLPMQERRGAVLLGIIERYTLRKMGVRLGCHAQIIQCRPQSAVRRYQHGGVLALLGEGQELFTQGMRRLMLGTYRIMIPESTQCWKQLLGLCEVLTEVMRTQVGLFHLRSPIALRGKEWCPKSDQQVYFSLDALKGLG